MAPVEWPIAAPSNDDGQPPARFAGGERLSVARVDFFLESAQRLTEQERSLMTAMLVDLVSTTADEIAAAAGLEPAPDPFEELRAAGLLDIPELISALLRSAEEERIAVAVRSRNATGAARFLHLLAGDHDPDVAAAAMAAVLGRSRRRDRYGAPRIQLDDVPAEAAVRLVYSVAAAVDGESAARGAAEVVSRHDESRRIEVLTFQLVHALEGAGRLDESLLRTAAADGEIGFLVEALARRAGISFDDAWRLLRGAGNLALLLRLAGASRQFAAEIAACFGDLISGGPAAEVGRFDAFPDAEVDSTRQWLRTDPQFRTASAVLGKPHGQFAR